ncbi:MAG: GMC family oxidoreductase N-terminal domain-containing protein [Solirubrobacterales bacterium]
MAEFGPDVIVVGAGSAGAAATRRLVDAGVKVTMLEAGARDTNPAIHDPTRAHELWFAPEDWAYKTTPQRNAADRRLHWPRGKVLGGSSSLNGMIWVRGTPRDWDHWAYLGNAGWSWADVLPIFKRIEDFDRGASELHGEGGIVHVISDYEPAPIHQSIVEAAQQAGIPFNEDHNGPEIEGVSYMQLSIRDGVRQSTATAYLKPIADHENLRIVTGAHARKLLLDGDRCVGVEWVRDGGGIETSAAPEVIVSCGTIESPPLLMRSGIGPAEHLREIGVDVVADLPGVGGNLHDHLLSPVIFSADREIGPPTPGLFAAQTHLWARSRPGLVGPDLQPIHFMVPLYEDWMEGPENGFSLMAGMIRPASRGTIRLTGPELHDELAIDPRVLSRSADVEGLVAAVALCCEIGAAPALRSEWGARELYPGPEVTSDLQIEDWVRRSAITYHHQVGTCKMGVDAEAVVDPRLRVHGIEGLRVADASIMPAVTSGNTNAPAVLIGERVADFLTEDQSAEAPAASAAV